MRDPLLTQAPAAPHFDSAAASAYREAYSSMAPSAEALARASTSSSSASATTYLSSREHHHRQPRMPPPPPPSHHHQHPSHRVAEAPAAVRWSPHQWRSEPPPPPVHRVYVLNCATCETFLSDRGMRAVLLLKPNIVLFSTDSSPCNASAIWPSSSSSDDANTERTCDCLTSSLACHGCGSTVGYHIVQPCQRCTASVQKHQRSANHHRFVFHHQEVVAKERIYFAGEGGVRSLAPTPRLPSPNPSHSSPPHHSSVEVKDGPGGGPTSRAERQVDRQGSPIPSSRRNGLRPGDVVYWHNLVQGGERSEPVDPDSRPPMMLERAGR